MADILIRGMEMPTRCGLCPMFCDDFNDYCSAAQRSIPFDAEKPEWCPLIPLPEGHGRLIDAGSLYDRLENTLTHFIKVKSYTESQKYAFGYCEAWNDAKAVLTNAPAIVPAEGGDGQWQLRKNCLRQFYC